MLNFKQIENFESFKEKFNKNFKKLNKILKFFLLSILILAALKPLSHWKFSWSTFLIKSLEETWSRKLKIECSRNNKLIKKLIIRSRFLNYIESWRFKLSRLINCNVNHSIQMRWMHSEYSKHVEKHMYSRVGFRALCLRFRARPARNCPKLPETAKNCPKLPKINFTKIVLLK